MYMSTKIRNELFITNTATEKIGYLINDILYIGYDIQSNLFVKSLCSENSRRKLALANFIVSVMTAEYLCITFSSRVRFN